MVRVLVFVLMQVSIKCTEEDNLVIVVIGTL
jgi:hypothetical protein